ncbi:bifunctional riboflavin kinase/FAD synthetase [Polymorphobacter megasporae]|uniref:bifunctional riboflavin kinase/FAD synthetase n=1 Tax=Glacieibacterium megasporae TaxID=2835787 RepID=UPI001C1DCEAE|nr:bifunctional riboflavin kinase/FAD synthetase [Polymorphobacter megasporae]UAJ10339.1 bifunctional riboflavin kinase/FAD synthetase [Polymorphobacter megasporae]
MERIFSGAVPRHLRGGVVALGNFDGFHRGHQAVVGHALDRARAEGRPALVATFDPHPAALFRPDLPPFALTTTPQKLDLFEAFGIDAAVVIGFDRALAAHSAEAFVGDQLASQIGAGVVVSGADFTFGVRRSGDTAALARIGAGHGIAADVVAAVGDGGGIVSSSRIRDHLRAADPAAAAALLTRPFTIRGVVEHGAKLGRTLGFPTANLALGGYLRPAYGVYAVRVRLDDGSVIDGVANLGIRPMIEPPLELLEVNLFDWSGDLYGRTIEVELHVFLRPEWKLDGLDALTRQIAADCVAARAALASVEPTRSVSLSDGSSVRAIAGSPS